MNVLFAGVGIGLVARVDGIDGMMERRPTPSGVGANRRPADVRHEDDGESYAAESVVSIGSSTGAAIGAEVSD
jgi:hypothetical protein